MKNEVKRLNNHIEIIEHEKNQLRAKVNFFENKIKNLDEYYFSEISRQHRVHPYVNDALNFLLKEQSLKIIEISKFNDFPKSVTLAPLLQKYKSDKDLRHSYANFYEFIINKNAVNHMLEIGIGSVNNEKYASGSKGGSVKAFRDLLPNSVVIGADIDKEAIAAINEPCHWVDQTNSHSLKELKDYCDNFGKLDLIIDDGFHDLHANVFSFYTLFQNLSKKGLYVVEDVHENMMPIWVLIGTALNLNFRIFDMRGLRPNVEDNILVVFANSEFDIL